MEIAEIYATIIVAFTGLLAVIAGKGAWQGRKDTKAGEGPSAEAVLKSTVEENTRAIHEQIDSNRELSAAFALQVQNSRDNNKLIEDVKGEVQAMRASLDKIHIELVRQNERQR